MVRKEILSTLFATIFLTISPILCGQQQMNGYCGQILFDGQGVDNPFSRRHAQNHIDSISLIK